MLALVALMMVSAPTERRLYPEQFSSSSFLWTDWNKFQENYHPNYAGDGDPKTAWVEGAEGTGVGETLKMKVTKMDGATLVRIVLANGYQKSPQLWAANGRIGKATLKLLPSGVTKQVTLNDAQGLQQVDITQPSGPLESIELTINSVYAGKKYEDTCLSDIEIFVTATTPENPAFEKTHLEGLKTWRQQRIDAAKLFAKGAKADVPLVAGYRFKGPGWDADLKYGRCEWGQTLCELERDAGDLAKAKIEGHAEAIALASAVTENDFADFTPVQVALKDKRDTPRADGVFAATVDWEETFDITEANLPSKLGYFRTSGFGTFAVSGAPSFTDVARGEAKACQSQKTKTFGWAKMESSGDGPARVRALLLVECALICSRDGLAPNGLVQLLIYDKDGNLELRQSPGVSQVFDWKDGRIVRAQGAAGASTANEAVATR